MGVEGRDKAKALEAGASALSGQLGRTVQRLRKAYNLSLSDLSEQSGVAKSIISQIERNETNPTLATIWRLAQALDVSIDKVLQGAEDEPDEHGEEPGQVERRRRERDHDADERGDGADGQVDVTGDDHEDHPDGQDQHVGVLLDQVDHVAGREHHVAGGDDLEQDQQE